MTTGLDRALRGAGSRARTAARAAAERVLAGPLGRWMLARALARRLLAGRPWPDRPLPDRFRADRAIGLEAGDDGAGDRPAQEALDRPQERRLVDAHERDRVAGRAGAAGPADPVDVVLGHHR